MSRTWVLPGFHRRFDSGLKRPTVPGNSTTHSRIMEPLQVVGHIGPVRVPSSAVGAVHALPLEHTDGPLACRVVAAMADCAHAEARGVATQKFLVGAADELAAAIRMQDTSLLPSAATPPSALPARPCACPGDGASTIPSPACGRDPTPGTGTAFFQAIRSR